MKEGEGSHANNHRQTTVESCRIIPRSTTTHDALPPLASRQHLARYAQLASFCSPTHGTVETVHYMRCIMHRTTIIMIPT